MEFDESSDWLWWHLSILYFYNINLRDSPNDLLDRNNRSVITTFVWTTAFILWRWIFNCTRFFCSAKLIQSSTHREITIFIRNGIAFSFSQRSIVNIRTMKFFFPFVYYTSVRLNGFPLVILMLWKFQKLYFFTFCLHWIVLFTKGLNIWWKNMQRKQVFTVFKVLFWLKSQTNSIFLFNISTHLRIVWKIENMTLLLCLCMLLIIFSYNNIFKNELRRKKWGFGAVGNCGCWKIFKWVSKVMRKFI